MLYIYACAVAPDHLYLNMKAADVVLCIHNISTLKPAPDLWNDVISCAPPGWLPRSLCAQGHLVSDQ